MRAAYIAAIVVGSVAAVGAAVWYRRRQSDSVTANSVAVADSESVKSAKTESTVAAAKTMATRAVRGMLLNEVLPGNSKPGIVNSTTPNLSVTPDSRLSGDTAVTAITINPITSAAKAVANAIVPSPLVRH